MSTGSVQEGLGDLVTARDKKCKVAVTVPVLLATQDVENEKIVFPCESSLSGEFYSPSFCFISAGLVTVSPFVNMSPRRKLRTFDKLCLTCCD